MPAVKSEKPEWFLQMENILETLNEGVLISDERHRILFVNSRLGEMLGVPPAEVAGQEGDYFYSPEEYKFILAQIERRERTGRYRVEFVVPQKNGSRLPVIISSRTFKDPDGREFAVVTFTDISEQKRAEARLRDVYHLDRPVEDFEAALAALTSTRMEVVPHIVIGLHYGRILGEPRALDIVSRYPVHSLVLVVIMPFYAAPGTFITPETADVGRIFLEARKRIPERDVLLGCARPPGMHKRVTDAYAVMAGLDGIAFPADGAVAVAEMMGRPAQQQHACCSMKVGGSLKPAVSCAA